MVETVNHKLNSTNDLALLWLIYRLVAAIICLSAHCYLLRIGRNIQNMLRSYELIKGYAFQNFCMCMYILHCGYLVFNWAVIPITTFLVATDEDF